MDVLLGRNPNLDVADLLSTSSSPKDGELVGTRPDWWWTGRQPTDAPGRTASGAIVSLPQVNIATATRQEVQEYFENTWILTEVLLSSLQSEQTFYKTPYHGLRHPLAFYLGHPAALYVNKLRVAGLIDEPLNPYFEQLFETGLDEMSWDDVASEEMEWPSIREISSYRKHVFELVSLVIANHPALGAERPESVDRNHPLWALFMGFEHERIHLETSSVLLRELPLNLLQRPEHFPAIHPSAQSSRSATNDDEVENPVLVQVEGGTVSIGKPDQWPTFGWDNEYGSRNVTVNDFEVSTTMITNAQYLEFVKAGGYSNPDWWTNDGWRWRTDRNVKWPTFWVSDGPSGLHSYRLRLLFEVIDLPTDWPVEVNYHEATAYSRWKSAELGGIALRLPTEAEHKLLASLPVTGHCVDSEPNAELRFGSPGPVTNGPTNAKNIAGIRGNAWEWLSDDFNALDGFTVDSIYEDFSTPCFDGEHKMIAGGSFISTGDEASEFARFHFRPHFFQHSGFRVARDQRESACNEPVLTGAGSPAEKYESDDALSMYLYSHYPDSGPDFPYNSFQQDGLKFANDIVNWGLGHFTTGDRAPSRALDIGCAVGGSSFALARTFDSVVAVDLSASFIDTAQYLADNGSIEYSMTVEGDIRESAIAKVDDDIDRKRVEFRRADATSLPPDFTDFDFVLAANLLCRLVSPRSLLGRFGGPRGLVAPGGLVVFSTPWSWQPESTPSGAWLGGQVEDGDPRWSTDGLATALGTEFELVADADLPFVLREHSRKYQMIVPYVSAWRRKVSGDNTIS